jgi:poly(glycerol-phosphate) alpha-glucosyltransferase
VNGQLVIIYDVDPETNVHTVAHYVVEGRYMWLSAEIADHVGTGPARYHASPGEALDFGEVLARWVDEAFLSSERLVFFADGENAWQRALRKMNRSGLFGVSVLHNSHLDVPNDASALTKPHWKPFFDDVRNVDVMVCLTSRQRAHLADRYGDLPLKVVHHAVPEVSGVDVTRDPSRVVFVGRLAEQKRLEDLIRAFDLVAKRSGTAHLDIYGHGPLEDEIRSLVADLGLSSRVNFKGHTTNPLEAFASARVAVMTSRHEGLPLTLTEGMSVGTPFVAYDINYGPAEVIRDGVDGYLVAPSDIETFAERLLSVLGDDDVASRLSAAAMEVTQRFSLERYQQAWMGLLHTGTNADRQPDEVRSAAR